jgi:predicted phosphodiesterase
MADQEPMTTTAPTTRRTRFVCVSDTHNAIPGGAFKLPPGDVLVHAGDMTSQGTFKELQKTVKWLEQADYEAKIVVAGKCHLRVNKALADVRRKPRHHP